MIADAKYKPFSEYKWWDYLQILAYMFRFDCKSGYYLYRNLMGENHFY